MKRSRVVSVMVRVLSILIIAVTATFSWIANYKETEAVGSGMTITIDPVSAIQCDIQTVHVGDFSFTGECVSSDGEKFYGITTNASGREIVGYHDITIGSEEYNASVFEFSFTFTSYQKLVLYLGSASYVTPSDDTDMHDYICGAVRLAFLHTYTEDEQTITDKVVWAPDMGYEYEESSGTILTDGAVEDYLSYVENRLNTYSITQVATLNYENGFDRDASFIWGTPVENVNFNLPLFRVTSNSKSTTTITCRIWIEGTDREAVSALLGGAFNVHLNFIIMEDE